MAQLISLMVSLQLLEYGAGPNAMHALAFRPDRLIMQEYVIRQHHSHLRGKRDQAGVGGRIGTIPGMTYVCRTIRFLADHTPKITVSSIYTACDVFFHFLLVDQTQRMSCPHSRCMRAHGQPSSPGSRPPIRIAAASVSTPVASSTCSD